MMDQNREAYAEEAKELLRELESALLELEEKPADAELVGRAFRALHTIKGSGAMFGFDEIAGFTHDLESAFDRVRGGQLQVTADLINLALAAGDQIGAMLGEAAGQGNVDKERSAGILADLQKLTGSRTAGEPAATASAGQRPKESGLVRTWHIRFCPAGDILLNGTNPILLIEELHELGELEVTVECDGVPRLSEIDPDRCYLAWDMVLHTSAGENAIRDVFIFVEEGGELRIEPVAPAAAGAGKEKPRAREQKEHADRASSTIRVSADKLDVLVNLVGELVTVQARLSELAARQQEPEMLEVSEEVERLTTELRENSMSVRMLPLRATFERFRRLVRDLGRELHKEVELTIDGADTELDKTVIDQLNDPLVHLVRNSMDHGIEPSEVRVAAGKPAIGRLRLSALYSGANVLIRVTDDGRGLDAGAIRARAIEKGLIGPEAQLSENDLFELILAPGFSTAERITDVSGRGVGMDVVRRSVENLRGSIEISSQAGAGMTVTLRLPLTLAIIDGLLVRIGAAYFVLPLTNVMGCVELTREDVESMHGQHLAVVRGEILPYVRLSEYFQMAVEPPAIEQIMVTETDHGRYGLVVDEVLGDHQTVIKNLGRFYRQVQVFSGATILGDGTVAPILDPQRLVQDVIRMAAK